MSPEERLAQSNLDNGAKLDELKSILSKGMKSPYDGVETVSLKGAKGDKGDKGDVGPKGDKGEKGNSIVGKAGKDGKDGKDGTDGRNGVDGLHGTNGLDGSPDMPDQIIEKIHLSKKLIAPHRIDGLLNALKVVDQIGKNPTGKLENVGGANPLIMLSSGVRISDFITEINFSTNLTAVYSGSGRVTLTATGGGGTTYSETPTGAINGSNKAYTTAHAITTIINFAINGQYIHPAEYSVSGTTITFVTALDASLSGTGFTVIYQ